MDIKCPECGATRELSPPHPGLTKQIRRCPNKDEWYVVFDDGELQVSTPQ